MPPVVSKSLEPGVDMVIILSAFNRPTLSSFWSVDPNIKKSSVHGEQGQQHRTRTHLDNADPAVGSIQGVIEGLHHILELLGILFQGL